MIKIIPTWNDNIDHFLTEIEQEKDTISEVVLNGLAEIQYNMFGGSSTFIYECIDLCDRLSIQLTLLTHFGSEFNTPIIDWTDEKNSKVKVIEWPTYWFSHTVNTMSVLNINEINSSLGLDIFNDRVNLGTPVNALYITLNNIAKDHRCLMMDLLAKYDLIDNGAIAWRDVIRLLDSERHLIPSGMTDSEYARYPYKYWKPKRLLLDQHEKHNISVQEIIPIEYNHAFMQLVAESYHDMFSLTEKTVVPLLFNKPFLVCSCVDFHKHLTELGFELYDELFDYSFDSEPDIEKRFEQLIANLSRYKNKTADELNTLLQPIEGKLQRNRKLALDYAFNLPEDIKKYLDITGLINMNLNKQKYGYTE